MGKHAIEPQLLTSRGSETRLFQLLVIPLSHFSEKGSVFKYNVTQYVCNILYNFFLRTDIVYLFGYKDF